MGPALAPCLALMVSAEASLGQEANGEALDVAFKCHYCDSAIGDGFAVYMCSDAAFCSVSCRRKGREAAQHLDHFAKALGRISSACALTAGSTITTETSLSSDSYHDTAAAAAVAASRPTAVISWLLGAGLRRVVSLMRGTELLKPPSGKDLILYDQDVLLSSVQSGICRVRSSTRQLSTVSSDSSKLGIF